jgi:hypothetical protein
VEIKNHVDIDNDFDFQNITAERVEKIINNINIKKATGADNIPVKVVRQCKVTVAQQLSSLGRQSKAFERSINTVATYWFLSRASCQSSRSLSSVV